MWLKKEKTKNINGIKKGEKKMKILSNRGFGINEIVGIAAGLIIAVLVVLPGLRTFASTVMGNLEDWWESIQTVLFN